MLGGEVFPPSEDASCWMGLPVGIPLNFEFIFEAARHSKID